MFPWDLLGIKDRRSRNMKLTTINETCFYFAAPVNMGYVHHGDQGMLIDAGIDESVMRKALRQLKEKELPITHLFITHAHADHYGGAYFLQKRHDVHTIAPVFEAAILTNPSIEPLYLLGGNEPLPELNNKFLQGSPIRIDEMIEEGKYERDGFSFAAHLLPGHSYYQLGIEIDGILYAADSYFGEEQLYKHKITYITDADLTIKSLKKLEQMTCGGAVPGHGSFEVDFKETVEKNIAYHESLLTWVYEKICANPSGITHETLVAEMCDNYGIDSPPLSQWLLFRTAATAYLIGLIKQEKIIHQVKRNRWIFTKSGD